MSRNTLPFDFLTAGELFQNNHHKFPMSPNFAARWFEIDTTYQVMRLLQRLGIIDMSGAQVARWKPPAEPALVAPPDDSGTVERIEHLLGLLGWVSMSLAVAMVALPRVGPLPALSDLNAWLAGHAQSMPPLIAAQSSDEALAATAGTPSS